MEPQEIHIAAHEERWYANAHCVACRQCNEGDAIDKFLRHQRDAELAGPSCASAPGLSHSIEPPKRRSMLRGIPWISLGLSPTHCSGRRRLNVSADTEARSRFCTGLHTRAAVVLLSADPDVVPGVGLHADIAP
jgi:hypothetical protein